jgi:hypothetical protein
VNRKRAPLVFWSDVPYLAPECGDHKIIWELNRHQHWIALGRAFWLTGDARYRDRFVAELGSWIDRNPPLMGINWASMLELAFRSLSWMWAIQFFVDDHKDEGSPWLVDLLLALDRQLTHVERNLSYYFSPNTHLLGEALALYVAGRALPELAASPRREKIGRTILLAEIDRQIGADGGHSERSTHYHRYTLDFYALALTIARITGDEGPIERFEHAVAGLGSAARLLADDQGRIPHIGDDDGGMLLPIAGRESDDLRDSLAVAATLVANPDLHVGPLPEEAIWMLGPSIQPPAPGARPQLSAALPDTGYFVSRSPSGDHLVIDGGPLGYRNGGHAHADALSLTLSVGGVPLLIDPGTGCYTTDPALRDRLRSTALHNTLTLDNRPQSVSNGPFQWSHVAKTRVHAWRTNGTFDFFDAGHDGYHPAEHRRRVLSLHGDLVVVADLVSSTVPSEMHGAAVHWHLDPRWTIDVRGRRAVFTHACDRPVRVGLVVPQGLLEEFSADEETGLGWHSPVYGRVERTTTVRVSQSGSAPFWMVSVFDLDSDNPVAEVDWVPVWAEAGAIARATAIRITRAASVDHVLFAEPSEDTEHLTAENAESAEKTSFFSAGSAISALREPQGVPSLSRDAVKRGTWRVGEFETDARMLFCRTTPDHQVARLAIVDGSMVRIAGRRDFRLALPRSVPSFAADYAAEGGERTKNQGLRTKD